MRVSRSVVLGTPSFGIGKIRFWINDSDYYTMVMLFLGRRFAVGFHYGGCTKLPKEEG